MRTRRKVVEVDEDDEDEDDAMQLSHTMEAKDVTQGTTQEAGDGDESESPGFLTDDVESSSEDEERASRWRAKRGKAATKGKAAQKRQHAAVKKGGSASSSEDEVAVVKVVAPRRGVSKTIGLKRSRPEGTESAMGPRMGPLLSFMQRAENGGSSNRLAASKSSASEPQDQLWTDKYRPKKAADLSIPPKKVEEVRSWLLRSGSKGAPVSPSTPVRHGSLNVNMGPPVELLICGIFGPYSHCIGDLISTACFLVPMTTETAGVAGPTRGRQVRHAGGARQGIGLRGRVRTTPFDILDPPCTVHGTCRDA